MKPAKLLFGHDPTERIVAVESANGSTVRLHARLENGQLGMERRRALPWLITTPQGESAIAPANTSQILRGELPLNRLVEFSSWREFCQARDLLRQSRISHFSRPTLVDQYLLRSGTTLFKGMEFSDLVRLQLDVETTTLDPDDPAAQLIMIAVRTSAGEEFVLSARDGGEASLIHRLTEIIRKTDPDVIEGHNLFQFDIPFVAVRARRHGLALTWGRDGSAIRDSGIARLRAGARSIPFHSWRVDGRHVLDTYHQVQRYDTAGEFTGYGLKQSISTLGLQRSDRTFIDADDIEDTWEKNPSELAEYALDDVRDVASISELTAVTDFYQTQMVPRTFQDIAVGGPGERINLLMARAYLASSHALPVPGLSSSVTGGFTEVRHTGSFHPVTKCDVESLYPAIMLAERIAPKSDRLGLFLGLLEELTSRRMQAKRAFQRSSGVSRYRWNGLQSSFKILINSFYGYLGYTHGIFNDFAAADQITRRGQKLIRDVVEELERRGAIPIEIDTDGVYFQPPADIRREDEVRFIEMVGEALPKGITLAHDGSFAGMLSLKIKNYALLNHDGSVILRGSSLRSRRDEPILRDLVEAVVPPLIHGDKGEVRSIYFAFARRILVGDFSVADISRTESITDKTFSSSSNRRLAAIANGIAEGERVRVYEREDGSLALARDWANDANRTYLLKRLHDTAQRFVDLFDSPQAFRHTFPLISPETDIDALEQSPPVEQLGLFG